MYDRKRKKEDMFRSIRRALWYLDDAKRQYINSNYNRGVNYSNRARDEIKYILDVLSLVFK